MEERFSWKGEAGNIEILFWRFPARAPKSITCSQEELGQPIAVVHGPREDGAPEAPEIKKLAAATHAQVPRHTRTLEMYIPR
jgi:hypothetical protein